MERSESTTAVGLMEMLNNVDTLAGSPSDLNASCGPSRSNTSFSIDMTPPRQDFAGDFSLDEEQPADDFNLDPFESTHATDTAGILDLRNLGKRSLADTGPAEQPQPCLADAHADDEMSDSDGLLLLDEDSHEPPAKRAAPRHAPVNRPATAAPRHATMNEPADVPADMLLAVADELELSPFLMPHDEGIYDGIPSMALPRARSSSQSSAAKAGGEAGGEADLFTNGRWLTQLRSSLASADAHTRMLLGPCVSQASTTALKAVARLSPRQVSTLHKPCRELVQRLLDDTRQKVCSEWRDGDTASSSVDGVPWQLCTGPAASRICSILSSPCSATLPGRNAVAGT